MSDTKSKIEERDKRSYTRGKIVLSIILVLSISAPILYVITNLKQFSALNNFIPLLLQSSVISIAGFLITYFMIPVFMKINHSKKIFGVDINKVEDIKNLNDPHRKEVPESLGIVPATVFLVVSIISQTILSLELKRQLEFNASLLSICFMIFLGFADDILDLRWRYKLFLPTIASIPLLIAYSGSTSILLPKFIQPLFNGASLLDLGIFFQIYMSMLAVFCTNAINIYAGINGLEVGQSIIIGISIIFYNLVEILGGDIEQGLFSLAIILPFVFTSLALFMFNKYPSDCFIGDTYCYFAGMTFACAGILGHYSKTLLLFFIPQILNFVISIPQLFGIIHCPRHRLPKYNASTKLLTGQSINWNLLNVFLRITGPAREQDICNYLLIFQIFCSMLAFLIRFKLLALLF